MAKLVIKTTFDADMQEQVDLTTLPDYTVSESAKRHLSLDSGLTHVDVQGVNFANFDDGGFPGSGTIKTVNVSFLGAPVFTLAGMDLTVAELLDFADANDAEGLRARIFQGKDEIYGNVGDDHLLGYAGKDHIEGGDGADTLEGGAGDDALFGGEGQDVLTGGADKDTFKFKSITESTADAATADVITDLESTDKIDLRGIDAKEDHSGNNGFHLVHKFSGESGEAMLKYQASQEHTLLMLDTDGDKKADMVIVLEGGDHRDFDHFVL